MKENKSLADKYRKIDINKAETLDEVAFEKPQEEKKAKKEKIPKEKKVKEPKQPKEKKVKEPKPEKVKKEKVEKLPKEKKSFFANKSEENKPAVVEEINPEVAMVEENQQPQVVKMVGSDGRVKEEIVLPVISKVKKVKPTKKDKLPKEKKQKEPKPPKEKKAKEPKPEKVKEPKVKKEKAPKVPKEKKPSEPLNKKDFATIGVALVAVVLACTFAYFKFFHNDSPQIDNTTKPAVDSVVEKLSDVQIVRNGVAVTLVQTDIPDVFYGITPDYKVKYYQYRDNKMVAVQATNSITTEVDFGNEILPVTINYVKLGSKIFGIGLFVAEEDKDVYFYNMMAFKLTNLPAEYNQERKGLLLATTNKNALTQKDILWPESFTIDLETGKISRFLQIINRNIDINTGAGVTDFCILTKPGYASTSTQIPFITAREYEQGSGKLDIFVKNGNKETLFAEDVYGKFLLTDGDDVIFMRKTNTGFDVVRKNGETETKVCSFYGTMGADYLQSGNYLLNVNDGNLYNLLTGEKTMLVGFRMDPELMVISDDGKYVVMLGTVKNMMDYQVHIFNLQTGAYAKFEDQNYSSHSNLTFINNATAVYTALDPNQGYEYVVLDVSKIK